MLTKDRCRLTLREASFPCGYEPRAIHLANDRGSLFVGARDGSIHRITHLSAGAVGKDQGPLQVCGSASSGIRSLSEWQPGWLWVTRRGGEMELIDVESLGQGGMAIRHSLAPYLQAAESGDPVRTVGWVDARRGFVSFHSRGTWVLPRHPIAADDPASVLDQSFGEKVELRIQNHPLSQLLFIVPLDAPAARRFVLGNRRGEIFAWDGDANGEVERVDLWPEGEEPALVSDIAVLWNDSQREECKQARGVFIATDRGVHLVYGDGPALRRVRLDLPGLGAVCMVIAYAESRNAGPCHVWAADSRGDSHLYWGDPSQDLAQINFRASGISHAGSQSTRAVSWFQEEGHSLMVGQARRNNQIVLFEYRDIEQAREDDDVGKIRRLLSQGSKQAIRDFWKSHEDASSREIGREWPLAAQLSELFEVLAEESSTLKPLLEFLGDPTARVAWEILEEILLADNAEKACEAIELWTLSLLGIVNRTGGDLQDPQREAAYLGIVRWLLDLRQRGASSARACEAVIREIDESIGIVRKWGLFGEANGLRENLVLPLSVLRAQDQAEQGLDRLTYEVLLFERGLDLRAEDRRGKLPGRNAWDISGLELGGRKFFAVSWHWGGVELCELQQGAGQELEFKMHLGVAPRSLEGSAAYRFQVLAGDEIAARDPQRIQRSQFGHSRAVLLAKLATGTGVEKGFLLTAPALSADSQESFHLWELVLHGDRIETRGSQPYDPSLPAGESVYSLLDLGNGCGVAGLRSNSEQASCLLFQVVEARGPLALRYQQYTNPTKRGMEIGGFAKGSRNRVWSLASFAVTAPEREERIAYRIVLGCENGEILLLTLRHQDAAEKLSEEWELVARMSSPVKALTCRRVVELGALRIVAGGADGSVVAWQELPTRGEDTGTDPANREFAALWAFYEGEEISGLHLVNIPEADGSTMPMVLAITRAEQCFLYNDRHAIADSPLGAHPGRISVPGSRYGHFQRSRRELPSAFASYLVPEQDRETGRVAALMTASKHGVIRLLSVHYPHFHWLRKEQFREILKQWWATVKGNHQLRLVHAVYRSAPSVELILVRWLLDPSWPEDIGEPADRVQPWMLPRHLRLVLKLRQALKDDDEAGVYENLLAALREAFRLEDLHLFEEICEMLLRRGNFELFTLAHQPGNSRRGPAAVIYLKILDAIEQSIPQWQGSKDRQESQARITVAKNLVDGDTFLRIADAALQEVEEAKQAKLRVPTPFLRILQRRIRGARELIIKRDPRVSLEALRAANLSLQRLCKRLQQRRAQDPGAQVAWEGLLEPYFQELTAAAARVFRSPLELNDAMAHGFARTFALAVCACPSAALRIATRMAETQLISDTDSQDDLCNLVPRQFQLLEQLGTPVPKYAQDLFRVGSKPPNVVLNPLGEDWLWKKKDQWKEYGCENERDLLCLFYLSGIVSWFTELETGLSKQPEDLDTSWAKLEGRLNEILREDVTILYRHSVDFWLFAIREFADCLLERQSPSPGAADAASCREALGRLVKKLAGQEPDQARIRPRTVLLSRKIAVWSTEMMEELRRRHDQLRIFQPEYTIFQRLFDRLRRAAEAFPQSAAVRMNLVQGVLGHHLLEDLDEHILELQEIAHVLDPPLVRDYRKGARERESSAPIAQSFAMYLMERSERAESLPKNLRTLFELLDRTYVQELLGPERRLPPTYQELLKSFETRDPRFRHVELGELQAVRLKNWTEFLSLRLILEEIDRNDRKHTAPGQSTVAVTGRLEPGARPALEFDISFVISQDEADDLSRMNNGSEVLSLEPARYNLARLWTLEKNELQGPIEPRPDREVASSGMGLYMANFAAAIVGWELKVAAVSADKSKDERRGRCVFHLTRQPAEGNLQGGQL